MSEEQARVLLNDLMIVKAFSHHKGAEQNIELNSKIELLEWILEK